MELANSSTGKKLRQLEIFKAYAKPNGISSGRNELVLNYNDFIDLLLNFRSTYSNFAGGRYNLNEIPRNVFGCIFFAMDENNKGYLNLNDWFHFNNILEYEGYQYIILFEFFRKFEVKRPLGEAKSINYGNKFLTFDELYLNAEQFRATLGLLHDCVTDQFIVSNDLFLDWNGFEWFRWYEVFPRGSSAFGPSISLNSIICMIQNDIREEKLRLGFNALAYKDVQSKSTLIMKDDLISLMRLFYSHRVPVGVFSSLQLAAASNSGIQSGTAVSYTVFRDLFFLFHNFDILNQLVHNFAQAHAFTAKEVRERPITKNNLLSFLNVEYNKVNNIIDFTPTQLSLLFSVVSQFKKLPEQDANVPQEQKDSIIESFLQEEYLQGGTIGEGKFQKFREDCKDIISDNVTDKNEENIFSRYLRLIPFLKSKLVQTTSEIHSHDNITLEDVMKIVNPNYLHDVVHRLELKRIQKETRNSNMYLYPVWDSIYNFFFGSIAGCIGATAVYPIDMIKTRMQAQRANSRYKSYLDCMVKIFSREGIRGMYSGLGPQLIGVAPEKAIKLTVNDYMREALTSRSGKLSFPSEVLAGASAGACQVMFTNPLEIVKIRLQVKSESTTSPTKHINALSIVRSLGFRGLYKGAGACLLRDIPFSAIYFPSYAHFKADIFHFDPKDSNKRSRLSTWQLLVAGALAGMPAAFLTTPVDVVKTRLQIEPRKGESMYNGIWHAFRTIFKEEGLRSFFKGGPARVLRSSPQFGFTLAAYEIFQNIFPTQSATNNDNNNRNDNSPKMNSIFQPLKDSLASIFPVESNQGLSSDLYGPTLMPYRRNFFNYYNKSCETAKLFMDLDYSFAKFDYNAYQRFHSVLKTMNSNNRDT
ncbi:HHL153Cp [Eremothecium sinecaudum]|uniref:Mitochondrial aspartate-glutamate transporter AGC1 n=1 Tax=Eremothecium sinecaudum TaxID=45286 RepID=A0A0X8HW90_9SACH|nr:HHL153Cp [Eremothecium sinecaudum]AMD22617.1 HHL153Cp [Eremothecium sinecaudum]